MGRLALCDVVGPLHDLNQKLAGENGAQWLEHLKTMLRTQPVVSGKLTWQEAEEKAYGLMGMATQYAAFRQESGVAQIEGHWVAHMVKDITCTKIISVLKEAGSAFWSYYDDLDKEVTRNDRDANRDGSYVRAFRAEVEADEENADKSANQLVGEKHQGITLMERLFLELVYFLMTSKHLDIINITLCTGSRYADGSVPDVSWSPGNRKVQVNYYGAGRSFDGLRSRSAVSLPVESCASATEQAIA